MGKNSDINHRVQLLKDDKQKLNALERSRRLKSLQVTENKLISRTASLKKQVRLLEKDIAESEKQLAFVQVERRQLEEQKSPIVTEHALLRYAERVLGLPIAEWHENILALPPEHKTQHGSTIVTVFTEPTDHFNLAEREAV